MLERSEEIQGSVDAVYDLMASMGRGETLTHQAITGAIGLRPYEGSWKQIIDRSRRRLEQERGIATWTDPGVGYKLLTVSEQVRVGELRTRKAQRQLRRGRRSVEALPDDECSMRQRQTKFLMAGHLKGLETNVRKELKAQEEIFRPTQVIPRRALQQS